MILWEKPDHVFVIAEAGVNHNGNIDTACELIEAAAYAKVDAVKFQKRTPHFVVKPEDWDKVRDTPWGPMKTIDYRQKIELSWENYQFLMKFAHAKGLQFSASPWDVEAANGLGCIPIDFFKIASAHVTRHDILEAVAKYRKPVILSTGMSTYGEVFNAVQLFRQHDIPIALLACTSTYPCKAEDLNLERIRSLKGLFPDCMIGYSGHEPGLWTTLCAVAMGAQIIERHITLDRSQKGSDHAASIEPDGFKKLVREIRQFEIARGDGKIGPRKCEEADMRRLRG